MTSKLTHARRRTELLHDVTENGTDVQSKGLVLIMKSGIKKQFVINLLERAENHRIDNGPVLCCDVCNIYCVQVSCVTAVLLERSKQYGKA